MDDLERLVIERACTRTALEHVWWVDSGHAQSGSGLFTEDCRWYCAFLNLEMNGRRAIEESFGQRQALYARVSRHICSNVLIDVIDRDTAEGITYLTLYRSDDDSHGPIRPACPPTLIGAYHDRFRRGAGRWQISARELVVQFASPELLAAAAAA